MLEALPQPPGVEVNPASDPLIALSKADSRQNSSMKKVMARAVVPKTENASKYQYPSGSALRLLERNKAKKTFASVARVNGSRLAGGALGGIRKKPKMPEIASSQTLS
mmetsp:Transcript_24615/g.52212  ORF Transcript_24615/g.52212 Transcript_24615/m.52212 type:complete len:108 (-) Transcript_24615:1505-1828(-)